MCIRSRRYLTIFFLVNTFLCRPRARVFFPRTQRGGTRIKTSTPAHIALIAKPVRTARPPVYRVAIANSSSSSSSSGSSGMKKPRQRGAFALVWYLGAATTTTTTFPTAVSGFHTGCTAAGRVRRRPGGEALRPPPHRLQQQQQQQQHRQQEQQQQQQQGERHQQRQARGSGWGPLSVMSAGGDSGGSSGISGGTGSFWRGAAQSGRERLPMRRAAGAASPWLLRCAAAEEGGDDEGDNYVSSCCRCRWCCRCSSQG